MSLLTVEQLTEVVEGTKHDFFRIETLPSYDTEMTSTDFRRWLDGEAEPDWEKRQPWLDKLRRWTDEGRPRRRVRVIHNPITDYERYACDWGYRHNISAGELVRVMDLAEQSPPHELQFAPGDWSVIDGDQVVKMHYASDGQFLGAQLIDAQHAERHHVAMDVTWTAAVPFTEWWNRHCEYHRRAA